MIHGVSHSKYISIYVYMQIRNDCKGLKDARGFRVSDRPEKPKLGNCQGQEPRTVNWGTGEVGEAVAVSQDTEGRRFESELGELTPAAAAKSKTGPDDGMG